MSILETQTKILRSIMKSPFDVRAISEPLWNNDSINANSLYQIPNYITIHQIRKTGNKGGGLALYTHKTITFNTLGKLSNNNELQEALKIYLPVKLKTSSKDMTKTKIRLS